jgi:hypothetical protein
MSGLINPQLFQVEGKADRVKIELADANRVTLEAGVHVALDSTAQRLIDEIGEDEDKYQKKRKYSRNPEGKSPPQDSAEPGWHSHPIHTKL